jgi:hypothetical protein
MKKILGFIVISIVISIAARYIYEKVLVKD